MMQNAQNEAAEGDHQEGVNDGSDLLCGYGLLLDTGQYLVTMDKVTQALKEVDIVATMSKVKQSLEEAGPATTIVTEIVGAFIVGLWLGNEFAEAYVEPIMEKAANKKVNEMLADSADKSASDSSESQKKESGDESKTKSESKAKTDNKEKSKPKPPDGLVENPNRKGSWGEIDKKTGKFKEKWRFDKGRSKIKKGHGSKDHIHPKGDKDWVPWEG